MSPTPARAILDHIGQVFHKLGDREKALEYLEKAVELDPENSDYARHLEEVRNSESKEAPAEAAPVQAPKPEAEKEEQPAA